MNDIALKVENVSKVYRLYPSKMDRLKESLHPFRRKYHRDFFALDGVSLSVRKGETVGIIGKNGSGKSTILKIISGVLTPTAGSVAVNGRISAILELGAGFNPELTGRENIYFSGAIMGYSRGEMDALAGAIIAFADIGLFIDQPVKTYSSGMFVRLAFAVAINVNPDILIIDEALAVGDIVFQARCFRKFDELRGAGKTVLFVTHGLDSIIRYCDRALVLNEGRTIVEAAPKEAVDVYKRLMADCHATATPDTREPTAAGTAITRSPGRFRDRLDVSHEVQSYGNQGAEIEDFALLDKDGNPTNKLIAFEPFTVFMRVRFRKTIANPIFAFTIKDIKGLEITGTNTFFKHVDTGTCRAGEIVEAAFRQDLNIQAGRYALSLGCTGYEGDRFVVHHRLYDVVLFEVISDKLMVGFYDLSGKVTVRKAAET